MPPYHTDKRAGALCGTAVLTALAFFFSIFTVSWCEFAEFELVGGDRQVSFGMWRYQSFAIIVDQENNRYWKVDTCEGYPDGTTTDAYWKSSQAFSIIAPCIGGLASFLMCFGPQLFGRFLGWIFLFVTLCQALVFLFFKSDACDTEKNPLFGPFEGMITIKSTCEMGRNAIMGIIATCFWFLAVLVPCFCMGNDLGKEEDISDEEKGVEPFEAEDEGPVVDKPAGDEEASFSTE